LHSREIGVASKAFKICGCDKPSLEDSVNLSDSDIIAAEIVEDLQAALAQFAEIANDLKK
jgi:hypothetical protein